MDGATLDLGERKENFMLSAAEDGLLIICGWTQSILKVDALRYAQMGLSDNPHEGFFFNPDVSSNVILTHKGAKMSMSHEEANRIIRHVRNRYGSP